jgi:hypothetical protein
MMTLRLLGGSSPMGIISIFMLRRSIGLEAIAQAVPVKNFMTLRISCAALQNGFTFP